jgi:SAM-dependent methyltransferase
VSEVHPVAARGFSRSPDAYERARPDYPAAAIEFLALRLGIGPGRRVLDLAAGTGKLTRPLLGTGTDVVAVEPVAQMRAALPPEAHVLEGTAEAIPLADRDVDAVTVGQAFHWFDGAAALAEIHRVLRPGGKLALIWNGQRKDTPLGRAIDSIIEPHRKGTPTHRTNAWRPAVEQTRLFGPLEERHFPNDQELDAEGLVDRFRSTSFVAALDPAEREAVLGEVRALAADGPVTVRYDTEVHVCERRP